MNCSIRQDPTIRKLMLDFQFHGKHPPRTTSTNTCARYSYRFRIVSWWKHIYSFVSTCCIQTNQRQLRTVRICAKFMIYSWSGLHKGIQRRHPPPCMRLLYIYIHCTPMYIHGNLNCKLYVRAVVELSDIDEHTRTAHRRTHVHCASTNTRALQSCKRSHHTWKYKYIELLHVCLNFDFHWKYLSACMHGAWQ